jgi:hypothetical protein
MQISWFVPPVRKWPWQTWYNYNRVLASTWIRCLQLIPYLNRIGVTSQINKWDGQTKIAIFLRRWGLQEQSLAKQLKTKGIKIILDTPVNYFSNQDVHSLKGENMNRFNAFADLADIIFCSSSYIAQFGSKKGYNTLCLDDSVDFKHFCLKKNNRKKTDSPVLIWSGVSVKANSLDCIADPVKRHGWKVIIISDKNPSLNFDYTFVKWRYNTFPADIIKGDIGIFPRQAFNEYDLGHSFFKIGVFLAQHVPVVCTPLSSYEKVITSSNTVKVEGLEEEIWEQAINSIYTGEKKVDFNKNPVQDFSTAKTAEKYHTVFKEMMGL